MILAICNHKGGVAKTTTAYYLAAVAAQRRVRPLLIDMDPQSNLTRMCGGRLPGRPTIGDVLGGAHRPTVNLQQAKEYITFDSGVVPVGGYLVPAEIGLENVATGLHARDFGRLTALREALTYHLQDKLIIIDTPPNAGILTLNALVASTHVIMCADPEEDAIAGVQRIVSIVGQIEGERREAPAILGVLATRVDATLSRHAEGLAALEAPDMPPLLGSIPKRAGRDAGKALAEAYGPLAELVLTAAGLLQPAEVADARLAS